MNSYIAGTLVEVATYSGSVASPAGGFRDATGGLADPTTVTLKYRPGLNAAQVVITYPDARITKDGVGLYRAALDTTGSTTMGPVIWPYQWAGTGGVQAVAQNAFEVYAPYLP